MLNDLIRDGKIDAEVLETLGAQPAAEMSAAALQALPAATGEYAAALAILSVPGAAAAIPVLLAKLSEDGVAGIAAAWALGQLAGEDAVCAVIPDGRLDVRQNGYHALAVLAARGKTSAAIIPFLTAQVQAEIQRAKSGGTGLAEYACKPLAILGHPQLAELVQQVIENDRFCDRYELDRQRSAVASHGRDRDAQRELSAPWRTVFADSLYVEPAPKAPAPAPAPVKTPANRLAPPRAAAGHAPAPQAPRAAVTKPAPIAPQSPIVPQSPIAPQTAEDLDDGALDEGAVDAERADELTAEEAAELAAAGEAGAQPQPIDWKAFAESPEFSGLSPQSQGLVTQLGPLLEQLAAQAIRAALSDLSGQEFAALLLQVLPQALQPQHVQMALHPHALNGYQAMARWMASTGIASHGDDLVVGVKLVRQQLRDQMRKTGMLGGPDYSDPDEVTATSA